MRQVFNNIMLNAVQAMNGKGALTVSSQADEKLVRIRIQDTGCGLDKETKEKVFNPFFTTKTMAQDWVYQSHTGLYKLTVALFRFFHPQVKEPFFRFNCQ